MDASVRPRISIIVAWANGGVIGNNGDLPWHLPDDLQRFKERTMGHTVIVGRVTYESILQRLGHTLTGREVIVLSRMRTYGGEHVRTARTFEEALGYVEHEQEVFVIGGAQVYAQALPIADRMYVTEVSGDYRGDATFPRSDITWVCCIDQVVLGSGGRPSHTFLTYDRAPASPQPPAVPLVTLEHARNDSQRQLMERILGTETCPFCPAGEGYAEMEDVVRKGRFWDIRPNRWPYPNTRLHLLFILHRHVGTVSELRPVEWEELLELIRWAEARYGITGGSIGIRFGNPSETGATVRHLHAHLIVPDLTVIADPSYERVRFPMGPKRAE
ncbi:MAG: dihydrofolate reductase [bacterium]